MRLPNVRVCRKRDYLVMCCVISREILLCAQLAKYAVRLWPKGYRACLPHEKQRFDAWPGIYHFVVYVMSCYGKFVKPVACFRAACSMRRTFSADRSRSPRVYIWAPRGEPKAVSSQCSILLFRRHRRLRR